MLEKELIKKIEGLDLKSNEERNRVTCAMIGHSRIQTTFFGYYYCGRCGEQVGDSLGSVYDASNVVIVDHNCKMCQDNYKKLTWRDKLYVENLSKKLTKENSK